MSKYDYMIKGEYYDENLRAHFDIISEMEDSGKFFQWRNYGKNAFTKEHGRFANYCEDGSIEFHKGPRQRDNALPAFIDKCLEVKK